MKWAEYVLKIKEEKGISYGQLARDTGTSYSYWYNQIFQIKAPPTLDKARKLAKALGIDTVPFVNMVFRDRLLWHLEKQEALFKNPTKEIRAFIKSLQVWTPEDGSPIRYIMLTLGETLGMGLANKISKIEHIESGEEALTLNQQVRDASFPSVAETEQGDFSEDLEGVTG